MDMQRAWVPYIALILVLGAMAYSNSLGNGLVFDDRGLISENPVVHSLDPGRIFSSSYWPRQPATGLFRPLTTLTYAVNYRLHGLSPFGYHLVNLLIHLANGLLVFWIISRMLGHAPSACVAALAFVLHPVQTEAVNSVVGRAELLAAFWVLLAWVLYIRARSVAPRIAWGFYAASACAALLGCLSKENAVTLVGILVIFDVLIALQRRDRIAFRWQDALRYTPYVLVVLVYLAIRYAAIGSVLLPARPSLVDNSLAHLPVWERTLTAVSAIGKYMGLLVFPLHLSADYSYNQIPAVSRLFRPGVWVTVLVGGAAALTIIRSLQRRWAPEWGLGPALWAVTLLPFANLLFPIGTPMAERLLYLPCLGFCLLLGVGYQCLVQRAKMTWVALAVAALLLGAYGVRTFARNPDWHDDVTLFSSAVEVVPKSAKAHFNLGNALRDRKDLKQAIASYRQALKIYPQYAEVYFNVGVIYQTQGNLNQALDAYDRALQLDSLHVAAWTNKGIVMWQRGKALESATAFSRALAINPNHLNARYNYGLVCQQSGWQKEAEAAYQQVLAANPGYEDAVVNLAALYREQGDTNRAFDVYQKTLETRPDARRVAYNLGSDLEEMGRFEEAVGAFDLASQEKGDLGIYALIRMAKINLKMDDQNAFEQTCERFLARKGDDPRYRRAAERLFETMQREAAQSDSLR